MIIRSISFTKRGYELQKQVIERVKDKYRIKGYVKTSETGLDTTDIEQVKGSLRDWTKEQLQKGDVLLFIGACGIAVRSIAPFIQDKWTDPAVLVMDEKGEYIISLLAGHVGGANEMAKELALYVGGTAIITTATDKNGLVAPDMIAKKNHLHVAEKNLAKEISAALLRGLEIPLLCDGEIEGILPKQFIEAPELGKEYSYGIHISYKQSGGQALRQSSEQGIGPFRAEEKILHMVPQVIHVGIGCKKDTDEEALREFVKEELNRLSVWLKAVKQITSIDRKKEEKAIKELAEYLKVPFITYSENELKDADGVFEKSEFVEKITGVDNVCERAAVLSARGGELIIKKRKKNGMTMAAAVEKWKVTYEE